MNPNVTLIGKTIKLEPLECIHKEDLLEILVNPSIWEFTWRKNATYDDINHLIKQAMQNRLHGTQIPFVVVELRSGKTIGTTRIGDIDFKQPTCGNGLYLAIASLLAYKCKYRM